MPFQQPSLLEGLLSALPHHARPSRAALARALACSRASSADLLRPQAAARHIIPIENLDGAPFAKLTPKLPHFGTTSCLSNRTFAMPHDCAD
jgi:hypothetical protein